MASRCVRLAGRCRTQSGWHDGFKLPAPNLRQRVITIEQANVLCLDWRQPPDRPGQMDEVRFMRHRQRLHAAFMNQPIALPRITRRARSQHVGPFVGSTTRHRNEVIARQIFARAQRIVSSATVLTRVAVARKEERIRHLTTELSGDVYEPRQPDDRWPGNGQAGTTNETTLLRLDDDCLAIDHQAERPSHRDERQWFKRRIERQAAR